MFRMQGTRAACPRPPELWSPRAHTVYLPVRWFAISLVSLYIYCSSSSSYSSLLLLRLLLLLLLPRLLYPSTSTRAAILTRGTGFSYMYSRRMLYVLNLFVFNDVLATSTAYRTTILSTNLFVVSQLSDRIANFWLFSFLASLLSLHIKKWVRVKILNSQILEWLKFRIWKLTNVEM